MPDRMDDVTFARHLAKARKANAQRDQIEREHDFAALSDCDPYQMVMAARMAIQAGIQVPDLPCLFEAYAILEDAERLLKPAGLRKES